MVINNYICEKSNNWNMYMEKTITSAQATQFLQIPATERVFMHLGKFSKSCNITNFKADLMMQFLFYQLGLSGESIKNTEPNQFQPDK